MMNRSRGFALAILLLVVVLPSLTAAEDVWVVDTLSAAFHVTSLSLAVDSTGTLHASFNDASTTTLHYGTWDGGNWAFEALPGTGSGNAIAATPLGDPKIAFVREGHLHFAEYVDGAWTIEPIETTQEPTLSPSLGLDSSERPHVAYFEGWSDLYYAVREETTWVTEKHNSRTAPENGELIVASDGSIHLSHLEEEYGFNTQQVILEQGNLGAWDRDTVETVPISCSRLQLALDSEVLPRLAYVKCCIYENSPYEVFYKEGDAGGAWTTRLVESVPSDWTMNWENLLVAYDLQVGPDDLPYVLYQKTIDSTGVSTDSLFLASEEGPGWRKELVTEQRPLRAALVLDAAGRPYVLYSRSSPDWGLYLARRVPSTDVASADATPSPFGLRVSPHPVQSGATISFSAPPGAGASIRLYDVRGRLVETIRGNANAPALFWEGRDAAGVPLPSGVYFLRLDAGDRTATRKVILTR